MYIPSANKIDDAEKIARFIEQNSFATVITQNASDSVASHLPLLFDVASHRLLGHMARANSQWQHFADGRDILAIFHGPHAYISPRWYETTLAVPTWNYAVVHVYGKPKLIEDEAQLADVLKRTVRFYEGTGPNSWNGELPAEYEGKLMKGIVGFEIGITRIEAKFKLGQNRSQADIAGMHAALSQSSRAEDRSLAEFMKQHGVYIS
jgi:transcriptional regulator